MSVPAGYRSRPAALDDVDAVDRLFREWLDDERSIAGDGRA